MKQAFLLGGEYHLRKVLVPTNEDGTMRPLWVQYRPDGAAGVCTTHVKPDNQGGMWEKYAFLRANVRRHYIPTMASLNLTAAECDVIANRYRLSPWVADCGDEGFRYPEYFADNFAVKEPTNV